ncbi:hypothetical protein JRQ81_010045 [Phrynocephalus forsythii]|uniref:Sulfotransferase n=1 Tax=Phrynocephalus forsythii TaxID=171643 RepID=A0A9Q0Y4J9_9SAUR|nr:hypothetical protein JRQ81_010045 [Phrynocephalus forsythii]
MAALVFCNACFQKPQGAAPEFILTNCGHVICERCLSTGKKDECAICRATCRTIVLSKKINSDIQSLFMGIDGLCRKYSKELQQIAQFQERHRRRLLAHYQGKITKLEDYLKKATQHICHMQQRQPVSSREMDYVPSSVRKVESAVGPTRISLISPPQNGHMGSISSRNSQLSGMASSQKTASGSVRSTPLRIPKSGISYMSPFVSSQGSRSHLADSFESRTTQHCEFTPQSSLTRPSITLGSLLQRQHLETDKLFADSQDSKGEELLFTFQGVLYPKHLCHAETFAALETMEVRKDDMLVVAYPKCGTNWALQILNDMVAAHYGVLPMEKTLPMLEFGQPEKFQKIKEQPSPRVFATHLHYDNIPKSFFENKVKILVIFRNPKDTAVSYYHFYNKNPLLPTTSSWDEFFQMFMRGEVGWRSYFEHALAWDKHMDEGNVRIMIYEELKENLYEGVKQIADFYEFPLSEEKIQSIAEKATFQTMSSEGPKRLGAFASVLFRKGEVGDWKTLFTEAQSQEMDAKFEECLAGTKLGAKLKYDNYCNFSI